MSTALTAEPAGERAAVPLATKAVAVAACVAVGLRVDLAKGLTPGIVVMVLLLPVWWPQVRTSWLARVVVALTGVTVLSGLVLAWWVASSEAVDPRTAAAVTSVIVLSFGGFVVLLWARTVISPSAAVASFMVGVLAYGSTIGGLAQGDPWKFALARPAAVLGLVAVAWAARRAGRARPWLAVAVLLLLALVGLLYEARSEAGFLVLTAGVVVWQALFVGAGRRLRALSPILLIAVLGVALYSIATQLFVSGALGADIQARSTAQIDASGSLLLGGRPEWAATVRLMADRPSGYGLGVLADSHDVQLALDGFAAINADPDSGYQNYVTNYMTAKGFHLHSSAADLWANTGIPGLLLSLLVVVTLIWSMSASLAVGRAEPVLIYATMVVCWDIAFSPLNSSVAEIVLGIFLAFVSLEHLRSTRAVPVPVPAAARATPPPARPGAVALPGGAGPVPYGASTSPPRSNGGQRGLQ